MGSRDLRAGGRVAPAVAVLALLVTGAALLAQQGAVHVHSCVAAGAFGRVGLSLGVLRADAACPDGSYGIGDGRGAVGLVVAVAGPVLLAHLVGAVLSVGAAARLHRALRGLVAAVRVLPRRLAGQVALPVVRLLPVDVPVRRPGGTAVPGGPWWRGPPLVGVV